MMIFKRQLNRAFRTFLLSDRFSNLLKIVKLLFDLRKFYANHSTKAGKQSLLILNLAPKNWILHNL